MSWGYFVSFKLDLSTSAWDALGKQTPDSVANAGDWTAFPTKDLAWYFTPETFGAQPFAKVFDPALWDTGEEGSGLTVVTKGAKVHVELFAMLDRSGDMMQESGAMARALLAATRAGGTGELLIVSDGTAPANGFRCAVVKDALVATPLTDDEAGDLLSELAAGVDG